MTDTDAFVTIREFSSEAEARLAQLNLESMGIRVHMQKDDCGGTHPELQMGTGVHLKVAAADAELARSILAEVDAEVDEKPLKPPSSMKSALWGVFFVGIFVGVLLTGLYFRHQQNLEKIMNDTLAYDNNGDGVDDEFLYYRDGWLVNSTEDRNADGRPDTWYYYEDSLLVRGEFDDNFDGNADGWTTYSDRYAYETKYDTDFDGSPDLSTYVKKGVAQRSDWRPGNAKKVSRRVLYKDGNRALEYIDTDRDGQFDRKCTFNKYEERLGCEPYEGQT